MAASIGLTSSAAVNVFARQFVARRGFPFEVRAPEYVDFENEQEVSDLMDELSMEVLDETW